MITLTRDFTPTPYAQPIPSHTPYTTPTRGLSVRSSRNDSSSPAISSSPPPLPTNREDSYFYGDQEKDVANDENISILDPRRFTPTLHANLVSEILSLRREVEKKNGLVDSLEESLYTIKEENDRLNKSIITNAKESRSMKRQLEVLEGGTLTALEELAQEKNGTAESLADARKRLDLSQRKVKSQEDEAERVQSIWERDRQAWEAERRALDHRVHIAEARLQTMVAEFAATRGQDPHQSDVFGDYGQALRPESSMSNSTHDGNEIRNGRSSNLSGRFGFGGPKRAGMSLAEELELDEEDEMSADESDLELDYASREELPKDSPHRSRPFSAQSHHPSLKARRLLGLSVEEDEKAHEEETVDVTPHAAVKVMDGMPEGYSLKSDYINCGTQFSPPPSPVLLSKQTRTGFEGDGDQPLAAAATGASQRLDPAENGHDASKQTLSQIPESPHIITVSQACQTVEQSPSSLDTSTTCDVATSTRDDYVNVTDVKTMFTQTSEDDLVPYPAGVRDDPSPSMGVPIIAIHPPITGSASDRFSVMLPPQTKNAICQVSISLPISVRSVSVQTEEIRVDRRSIKLPPHLLPSAISSKPPSPGPGSPKTKAPVEDPLPDEVPVPLVRESGPAEDVPSRRQRTSRVARDSYPGSNDNGPLHVDSNLKRPIRSGSLFAGFDDVKSGAFEIGDTDYSDDDGGNAEPIRKTLSKVQNSWKLVPQSTDSVLDRLESHKQDVRPPPSDDGPLEKFALRSGPTPNQYSKSEKTSHPVPISIQPDIRRTALISNGIVAHSQRVRSPSEPSIASTAVNAPPPPFPVPTRMSSRRIPGDSSEGARSPTPQSTAFFSSARRRDLGRPPPKQPVLRKVRSAAATIRSSQDYRRRSRSRSPPLAPPSSSDSDSPELPPLPKNNLISRYSQASQRPQRHQQHQIPPPVAVINSYNAFPTAVQQTSVVDAIAITMIGEWMWKYARRRKPFGIPESAQAEFESGKNVGDHGTRHKRWVWLAPYAWSTKQSAVMWSTKQPTSGPALLGKNGRKRGYIRSFAIIFTNTHIVTIQSVLDVRDDTPMPKSNAPNAFFGRSILILTPERALKFTATTRERHYVWLTALSFLSQSSAGNNELAMLPPVPAQEYDGRSTTSSRKIPIRDSIRVAKGKGRPGLSHANTTPNIISQTLVSVPPTTKFDHLEEEEDAAEPPHGPRTSAHTRKRSITGPYYVPPVPGSLKSHPSNTVLSNNSVRNAELEANGDPSMIHSRRSSSSKNAPSENGAPVGGGRGSPNFFDAVGTIRMEAFVDRSVKHFGREHKNRSGLAAELLAPKRGAGEMYTPYVAEEGKKPGRNSYRTRRGRKKDLSYWGANGPGSPGPSAGESVAVGGRGDGGRGNLFAGF